MARSSVSLHFSNSPYYPFPVTTLPTRRSTFNEPEVTTSDSIVSTKPCLRSYLQPNRCTLDGLIFVSIHLPVCFLSHDESRITSFRHFLVLETIIRKKKIRPGKKISIYICKYFATMLHDSLELAYRGKNSSPFFIKSRKVK